MIAIKRFLFVLFVICSQYTLAQDTIAKKLDEVIVATKHLPMYLSQKTKKLTDTIIRKNEPVLGETLKNNSLIYFKEYGRGMLSTVSFRGTTASQTAVLWNGININSPLNGSVDFNTISTVGLQSIEVKPGGGSVLSGSGAIGGSVQLNNSVVFNGKNNHQLTFGVGDFDTYQANYSGIISTQKTSLSVGISHFQSKNDYRYKGLFTWKGIQRKNENGQFQLSDMNIGFGYKILAKSMLKLFSQTSFNDRNISLVTESDPKTKYKINYYRNLLDYSYDSNKFIFNPSVAYLTEQYQYFPDNEVLEQFTSGQSNTFIGKINAKVQLFTKTTVSSVSEYNSTRGFGQSFGDNARNIFSTAFLVNQKVFPNWILEAGIRKELTNVYESPLLFSVGSVSVFGLYTLKVNASKNFRIPTFNDLYWNELGNPNLEPEISLQEEVTNQLHIKKLTLTATAYYNQIQKMIRWLPTNGDIWKPINIDNVNVLGFEGGLSYEQKLLKNHIFKIGGEYAYTLSENQQTKRQLTYTPFHRLIGNLDYNYKFFTLFLQNSFTGKVYTTSDNSNEYILKEYNLINIGFKIALFKTRITINAIINNLLDVKYSGIDKPMPGRNFNTQITFKI
ncbi:MAG: TonB-dependent receptor [Limnohabitans sp.]|nr:TonB-dependent receptor [Limnohabitans sp.]